MSSAGQEAAELAASAGLVLDPWEAEVLEVGLGERADGQWAAFEVGLIVPRQNGKGAILEARELAGLFLFGEELILHSAHEFKALDVSTPILTSAGWKTMGALAVGDEVFSPAGTLTKVVGAHPWRFDRPCYRLTFDDGQTVVADAEHLWEVVENGRRHVVTTQYMVDAGISTTEPRSGRDRRTYRFRVDLPAPLEGCHEIDSDLPPWLLGAWLGDGTRTKGELTVGTADLPYVLGRLDELGETYRVRPDRRWPDRVVTVIIAGLAARLRSLGVLGAKHIPDCYLLATTAQRGDLLAGVMDTDGTCGDHQIAVTMTNARLIDDVAMLVRSLGYKATKREFRASLNGVDAGPMYRVQFSASQATNPFQMPRKAANVKPRQTKTTRAHYNAIVAVEPVPSRPTRCITVDNDDDLYAVGTGFVPTHNTAQEAFRRLLFLVQSTPDLDRRVMRVRTSHGEEGLELKGGQRLRFVARSTGSGRGFSGDTVILDEAFNLPAEALAALLPTMSARPNPQLWYTSSAPLDRAESAVLRRFCARGRDGESEALAYMEFCAEYESSLDDPEAWADANPGFGIRISEEFIRREREALGDDDFAREVLGIWFPDDDMGEHVIPPEAWAACQDTKSGPLDPLSFALDVAPDRASAAFAVAGASGRGGVHVEVVDHRSGTRWLVDRAKEIQGKWGGLLAIAENSPAWSLKTEFDRAGVELAVVGPSQHAQACGQIFDAVTERALRHLGQPELNKAVSGADKRMYNDAWLWSRKTSAVDISPLVAVTLALWAHSQPEEDSEADFFTI